MPDFKAQLVKSVPPDVELEERAWNHYYKYHTCPATPILIEMIKILLVEEDAQKRA